MIVAKCVNCNSLNIFIVSAQHRSAERGSDIALPSIAFC